MIDILIFSLLGLVTGLLLSGLWCIPHIVRRKRTISRLMMLSRIGC